LTSMHQFIPTLSTWSEVFMHNAMRSFLQFSIKSGMSMSQIGALFWVLHKGHSDVSGVGDELGITTAAASQMVDRLVQQQLIVRTEDPQDRRFKKIELTDKGRKVLNDGICARQSWFEDLDRLLTDDEKAQVVAALDILIDRAGRLSPGSD
jgi:DNA-binding MarR family transcriptional regulator